MMHPYLTPILLGLATALALICSIGMLVMRDVFQRLQTGAAVVSFSVLLIVVAVFLEDSSSQSRIKVVLTAITLFWMNGVLTHATARAARIKQLHRWSVAPEERLPVVGNGKKESSQEGPSA